MLLVAHDVVVEHGEPGMSENRLSEAKTKKKVVRNEEKDKGKGGEEKKRENKKQTSSSLPFFAVQLT